MKTIALMLPLCCTLVCGWHVIGGEIRDNWPGAELAKQCQTDFLALKGRMSHRFVIDKEDSGWKEDNSISHVELNGDTAAFVKKYDLKTLALALWPYLDRSETAGDASVCLFGAMKTSLGGTSASIATNIPFCKWTVRRAFNQPNWWYPHQELFDRNTVLAESKTNSLARARYIAEMQKALSDPKIRTENPLEVGNILFALSDLNAENTSNTYIDYAFFDLKRGIDFRRQFSDTNTLGDVYLEVLPITTIIPRLGIDAVPVVLNRFANATIEERSLGIGGGASSVLAVLYFIQAGLSEEDAINVVNNKLKERTLTDMQRDSLNEIRGAIQNKLYRPDWLRRTSIKSKKTWAN